jgi:Transposase domain (DUF772)
MKLDASKNLARSSSFWFSEEKRTEAIRWTGFFDVDERLKKLSVKGDDLERLSAIVDFEMFRADLERAVPRSDRSKGGRPPYDPVLMFRVLILQSSYSLSDERTEYLIKDRLSFMRFLRLSLAQMRSSPRSAHASSTSSRCRKTKWGSSSGLSA